MCSKRDEVQRQILVEEEEKRKIQNDIRILTERLAQVNESLAQKIATRSDYDQTIAETEAAYKKVQKIILSSTINPNQAPHTKDTAASYLC